MYLNCAVEVPQEAGKITFRKAKDAKYVYYEIGRTYDPDKKYTNVKRVTVGKVLNEDDTKMYPNENFKKYFPDVELPTDDVDSNRSSCLKIGAYAVVRKIVRDLGLEKTLSEILDKKSVGMILDLVTYSIITEGNAAQYYPDYAYNHPLFSPKMKIYSDSTISDFLRSIDDTQRQTFLNMWNENKDKSEKIYISYDSTNKSCEAGDISIVEFGAAKVKDGFPIFNYAVAYDLNNQEPLFYEQYPGSINDISQLRYMVEKVFGYGYTKIGIILDRGYFSKENINHMDRKGYSFIIMVKGCNDLVSAKIRSLQGKFENNWKNYIPEFGIYGDTVEDFIYAGDTKKRYIHIFYSARKAVNERATVEEKIREMQKFLEKNYDKERVFNKQIQKFFYLHYYEENPKKLKYAEINTSAVNEELKLCGYFAIISSDKMNASEAIELYKGRDASEKVFRADKSFLGNNCLRVASEEAAANKIFIGFIALLVRCRIFTQLKNKAKSMDKKPNFLTVPAAMRELEKIEMTRQTDRIYRLSHAVTKTQKTILSSFNLNAGSITDTAKTISKTLQET